MILPEALDDLDLGNDVVEVGPGPGFTTDVLRTRTDRLTAVEIDRALADALAARLAGTNVEVICGDGALVAYVGRERGQPNTARLYGGQ